MRLVNSKVIAKWPLINHIRQIRALLSSLSAQLSHVFREVNYVADRLAALRLQSDAVYSSLQDVPLSVRSAICLDANSVQYVRNRIAREKSGGEWGCGLLSLY